MAKTVFENEALHQEIKAQEKWVKDRLGQAARVIEQTGGAILPKDAGSAWPTLVRTQDEWQEIMAEMAEEDKPKLQVRPTAKMIAEAEEAIFWPYLYVKEAQPLAALKIWIKCKAHKLPWQREAQRHGVARETAKRRCDRAIELIVMGLVRDGVKIMQ